MNTPTDHVKDPCDQLKVLLVEHGEFEAGQHLELAAHIAGCTACQRLLQAWDVLPDLLQDLPEHEPDEALVERVRESVSTPPASTPRRRYLAPSLATAAVLLAAVGISHELLMRESPRAPVPAELQELANEPQSGVGGRFDDRSEAAGKEKSELRLGQDVAEAEEEAFDSRFADTPASRPAPRSPMGTPMAAAPQAASRNSIDGLRRQRESDAAKDAEGGEGFYLDEHKHDQARTIAEASAEPALDKKVGEKSMSPPHIVENRRNDELDALIVTGSRSVEADGDSLADRDVAEHAAPEFDFLTHYGRTKGIPLQPSTGYWANTHVPGDPAMRLLSARLAQHSPGWLAGGERIERTVEPIPQPFDAPANNALALSLMADAAAIPAGEPTRFRMQVGIQGIEHRAGERPAMNLGVVVDLPSDAADATRIAARALIDALLEARQAGDRFALVVTGEPGLVIEPDDFRFGPLQLAKARILGRDDAQAGASPAANGQAVGALDTRAALERAGDLVAADDDPGRPLGSSAIVLIGARELANLEGLVDLTHEHATTGITTSVFPLGNGPTTEQAEQLVLAGLGSRRILEAPADARRHVEDELHASSRAVARAVRLSIRLAPGVKLVDVIGSERLDEPEAQRVREVENAMDRRLATDLGIAADRGQDEDGIQIVIPAIHAGDSAVILLDLVTDRPGPVAEVTLRYKDIVHRRNGSLAAQLTLPRAETTNAAERGPAELAVLKNLLAHHFTEAVEQAADAVGRGDPAGAAAILRGIHATIEQARTALPAWADDPELTRDQEVLERYLAALESPQALTDPSVLADSLRLAAYAKQHGIPQHWK